MNLAPKKAEIYTEIIMDGRILHENLKRLGLDLTWLDKQLKRKNHNNAKEIFLGICDQSNNLTLFPID